MQPNNQRRNLLIMFCVLLFVVILLFFLFRSQSANKFFIDVVPVPSDATITIDGQPAEAGKVSVTEGVHVIKGIRQFFGDATKEINTADLLENQKVYLLLDANTPEARKYLAEHPEEQLLIEGAFGAEFTNTQQKILDNYPFVNQLPYETVDYRIDYDVDTNKNISLTVTLYPVATTPGTEEYKQQLTLFKAEALEYIKDLGVNFTTVPIIFTPDPDQ